MARTRVSLQYFLEALMEDCNNTPHVYYQPPPSLRLVYPAIVYNFDDIRNNPADNYPYTQNVAYQVTVIDEDPDSVLAKAVSKLQLCRFDRFYTADNLNHFVYNLYY